MITYKDLAFFLANTLTITAASQTSAAHDSNGGAATASAQAAHDTKGSSGSGAAPRAYVGMLGAGIGAAMVGGAFVLA